jgi:hypothetical protein
MKRSAFLVAGVCVLATTQDANAKNCDKLVEHDGDTWYVTPSGDANNFTDGECIQRAFDEAQDYYEENPNADKPTVVFRADDTKGKPMPFYLGDEMAHGEDDLSVVTTSRGSFVWPTWVPPGTSRAKPVKIRAPVVAIGEPGSEIRSLTNLDELMANPFLIDHHGVEIRNMTFIGGGLVTHHGGLTVEGSDFSGSDTNIVIFTDDRSVYPHYDDPDPRVKYSEPRKSYMIGNTFSAEWTVGAVFPINVFMYASEIVFQGNIAYSDDSGLWMGGLDEFDYDPLPDGRLLGEVYTSHECRNNVIGGPGPNEGNTMEAGWAVINLSGHGSASDDNLIVNNEMTSFWNPIWFWGHVLSREWGDFDVTARRNVVTGNRLESVVRGIWINGTTGGFASDNVIVDNTITGAYEPMVLRRSASSEVFANTVEMDGALAGIQNDSDSSVISFNRFVGTGGYAVTVGGDDNILLVNSFSDFTYLHPDPVCETSTSDHTDPPMSTVDVTEQPPGPGRALAIDGGYGNRVQVLDDTSLHFDTDRITVAAWVHRSGEGDAWQTIVSKAEAWPLPLYFGHADGWVFFHLAGPLNDNWFPGAFAPSGAWTHLAASYDGDSVRLYVNGVLFDVLPVGEHELGLKSSAHIPLHLGFNEPWPNEVLAGLLDDVALWDAALMDEEIGDLYAGTRPDELGVAPVAYWPLDEDLDPATELQVVADVAGANDGYVNPHWCDPNGPNYLPGADVLFYYDTSDNLLIGDADYIDLGDNYTFAW